MGAQAKPLVANDSRVPEKETSGRVPRSVSMPEFLKEHKGTYGVQRPGEKGPEWFVQRDQQPGT